eukprot:6490465-Amphidinium_carterae.1
MPIDLHAWAHHDSDFDTDLIIRGWGATASLPYREVPAALLRYEIPQGQLALRDSPYLQCDQCDYVVHAGRALLNH